MRRVRSPCRKNEFQQIAARGATEILRRRIRSSSAGNAAEFRDSLRNLSDRHFASSPAEGIIIKDEYIITGWHQKSQSTKVFLSLVLRISLRIPRLANFTANRHRSY